MRELAKPSWWYKNVHDMTVAEKAEHLAWTAQLSIWEDLLELALYNLWKATEAGQKNFQK